MLKDDRGHAAVEFVIVAPVLITLLGGAYDIARVLLVRQQIAYAAEQIAQAANKLSISANSSQTMLTPVQMQAAMSTIYAAMPGLALGNGTGSLTGAYAVTLSSVVYLPLCKLSNGCTPESTLAQTPYTLWSATLSEGGYQLVAGFQRPCGALAPVAQFPDDETQLSKMIAPASIIMAPQVVADVLYINTPMFSWFLPPTAYFASATMPSSVGGTDQEITLDTSGSSAGVESCPLP